jgi:hypothetical protein|tara:strand:+ start:5494 stop:5652 length:159 start_codon:yes stop_codon:yes gene_type:complete
MKNETKGLATKTPHPNGERKRKKERKKERKKRLWEGGGGGGVFSSFPNNAFF